MNVQKTIGEHLAHHLPALSAQLQHALGNDERLSEISLLAELAWAEQHESLRLIVSAYRENLVPTSLDRYFVLRSADLELKAWDAASAALLRSPTLPQTLARIFSVDDGRETELIGVDGTLMALRPFLEKCQPVPNEDAWRRLLHASHQSVLNEAIAQAYKKVWSQRFSLVLDGTRDIFDHLERADVSAYHVFNQLAAFDARSVSPFSKMKLDLSIREVLAYSPEFSQDVSVGFAALRKRLTLVSVTDQYDDFRSGFDQLFPGISGRCSQAIMQLGLAPEDYLLIPVHPLNETWARQHLLPVLGDQDLLFLDGVETSAVPSLSFRSMLLPEQCLKLPAPLQTTHLIRNIAIPEIRMGPLFSDILHKIIEDEGLSERLVLERDLLGACLDHEKAGCSQDMAAMFGFVSRQNPDTQLRAGEHVIPAAGLFVVPPGKRRPFFFNILNRIGVLEKDAQYAYFSDYVRLIVGTQLELCFKTGLMLEAHQQNLNLVFDRNWALQRLMYHDIPGGVSAYTPLLRLRHRVPEQLAQGIFYFRDTPERSIFQFVHPTLTAHLGPLVQHMARQLKLDRRRLRQTIRIEIERCLEWGRSLTAASQAEAQARALMLEKFQEIVLGSATLPGKMMLGRLYLQSLNEDWGSKVPNPELLSDRVLIPPCDMHNFLTITESA